MCSQLHIVLKILSSIIIIIIMTFAFIDHSKSVCVRPFKFLLVFLFFKPHLDEV